MKKIGRVLLFFAMVLCGSLLPHIVVKADQAISVVKIIEISKTAEGYPVYVMDTDVGGVIANKNNPPCWYDPDGHICNYADFEPGKVYTWTVYFDLMSNYYFADDLKREGCTFPEWVNGADCYSIETKFICPSPIHNIDLRNIKLPVEGELPNDSYVSVVNNIKPIGSTGWKIPHALGFVEMGLGETFVGMKEYCYHVQFIAGDNYYFADDIKVTFNGEPLSFERSSHGFEKCI